MHAIPLILAAVLSGPGPADHTPAPLRHRMTIELLAPAPEVWALVEDPARMPEYSPGLVEVRVDRDASGRVDSFTCVFAPMAPGEPGLEHAERRVWREPGQGFASVAEEPNAFGLRNSLSWVRIESIDGGTRLTWEQYYDADDLPANQAAFTSALSGMASRLADRFGARALEVRMY